MANMKLDCCLFLLSSTQQKQDAKRDRRVKGHKRAIRNERLQREDAKEESEDPLRLWNRCRALPKQMQMVIVIKISCVYTF